MAFDQVEYSVNAGLFIKQKEVSDDEVKGILNHPNQVIAQRDNDVVIQGNSNNNQELTIVYSKESNTSAYVFGVS